MKPNDIKTFVPGYMGKWKKIDEREMAGGKTWGLYEHDVYGDETSYLVLDEYGEFVIEVTDGEGLDGAIEAARQMCDNAVMEAEAEMRRMSAMADALIYELAKVKRLAQALGSEIEEDEERGVEVSYYAAWYQTIVKMERIALEAKKRA